MLMKYVNEWRDQRGEDMLCTPLIRRKPQT
jgi:hypothetical protein